MESVTSTVLLVHIVTMSFSLVGSFLLAGMIIGTKSVNRLYAKLTQVTTAIGIAAGVILLVHSPAPTSCAVLIVYTMLFQIFYYKGVVPKIRTTTLH